MICVLSILDYFIGFQNPSTFSCLQMILYLPHLVGAFYGEPATEAVLHNLHFVMSGIFLSQLLVILNLGQIDLAERLPIVGTIGYQCATSLRLSGAQENIHFWVTINIQISYLDMVDFISIQFIGYAVIDNTKTMRKDANMMIVIDNLV